PDLAVATTEFSNGGLSVLLGNGDGTFQGPVKYTTDGTNAFAVAIGDVNGDGSPDIVTANPERNSGSVFFNTGDGTFQPAQNFAVGTNPWGVTLADVNNDGALDIVTANHDSGDVSVLLGQGDGTFQAAQSYGVGKGARYVGVGDFDGNGFPDLA